jgi:eukaryotic-like serine/threonine-protein kinase
MDENLPNDPTPPRILISMTTATTPAVTSPKHQLLGVTLASGWRLDEVLAASPGSSGGTFGIGYKASRGTEQAFVKAIDFWDALRAADPIAELGKLSMVALFERDVLEYCKANSMSRVLQFIGHEYVSVGDKADPLNRVSCLIMEAGQTDLRRLVVVNGVANCAWNLQVLRDVAMAVTQLHRHEIAHQDLKPSNVIEFGDVSPGGRPDMKVGDLGRVVKKGSAGPFDSMSWPGDGRYSPPERWYGHVPPDWCDAREASDAYMLGSLLFYLFTGTPLQVVIINAIPPAFRPGFWTGRYDQDLKPVLIAAHDEALNLHLRPTLMPEVADNVLAIAKALTDPVPETRGDNRARRQIGRPVGIDRIQQRIAAVAAQCAAIDRGRGKP